MKQLLTGLIALGLAAGLWLVAGAVHASSYGIIKVGNSEKTETTAVVKSVDRLTNSPRFYSLNGPRLIVLYTASGTQIETDILLSPAEGDSPEYQDVRSGQNIQVSYLNSNPEVAYVSNVQGDQAFRNAVLSTIPKLLIPFAVIAALILPMAGFFVVLVSLYPAFRQRPAALRWLTVVIFSLAFNYIFAMLSY